jgi:hypothetical protein
VGQRVSESLAEKISGLYIPKAVNSGDEKFRESGGRQKNKKSNGAT